MKEVPSGNTIEQQKESPLDRAKRLGIKDSGRELNPRSTVYGETYIARVIAQTIITEFEASKLPKPSSESESCYTLASTILSTRYMQPDKLAPSYYFIPPPDSKLPRVEMDEFGVTIINDEDQTVMRPPYYIDPIDVEPKSHEVIDVYEAIKAHGIRTYKVLKINLNTGHGGGKEALDIFKEDYPHTASMITLEMGHSATRNRRYEIKKEKKQEEARIRKILNSEKNQLGPFLSLTLKKEINELAGYTAKSGEKVLGSLATADEELLKAMMPYNHFLGYSPYFPPRHIDLARRHILEKLMDLEHSTEDRLLFPQPYGCSFERGELPIEQNFSSTGRRGGTLTVEEVDEEGNIPLVTKGKFVGIKIKPTDPDFTITKPRDFNYVVSLPTFELTLTEQAPNGDKETYKVWRANKGIWVQCSSSKEPKYYDRKDIVRRGTEILRKPVIYLYPKKSIDINVQLDYKGQITNTYPHITGNTWKVHARPNGTLTVNGKKYKYLFWDGVSSGIVWDWSEGFCVHKDKVDSFLEVKTTQLGLNFAEAQDFITYWAPMMKQNEWSLVSFQTARYEEIAKLNITPSPDTIIRLFMIFKRISNKYDIPEQKLTTIKRKGFTVVEWGGANLDELPMSL